MHPTVTNAPNRAPEQAEATPVQAVAGPCRLRARVLTIVRSATLALACSGALASAATASGLNCDLARAARGDPVGDFRPSRPLLDQLASIRGLGILSGWSFARLGGNAAPVLAETETGPSTGWTDTWAGTWAGTWNAHPFAPDTGAPQTEVFGGFTIQTEFGQPWLEWRIDISDPCEGRTRLPVRSLDEATLHVDIDAFHTAVISGFSFGGPKHPPEDGETLARIWKDARPILSSLTLSRQGETCALDYQTPDGPVVLRFFCERMSGGER